MYLLSNNLFGGWLFCIFILREKFWKNYFAKND